MPGVDGEPDSPPFRPAPFFTRDRNPMRPEPDEHHPWHDLPDQGLDPDQIPFDIDDDEETEPEPGDFYFDDDPRGDE